MASAEEMAELHRLSNDYDPVILGDLVGFRRSSIAISAEYAQSDPIYVRKTKALANTYDQYRPIKGDGNCGWRALAFGFFEALLNSTDSGAIERELARLKSYNNLLDVVGYDPDLYLDFVQETFDLLNQTAANVGTAEGEQKLMASFNDEGVSSSIITHFRLITSSWMKSNAAMYESFLTNLTIDQYRATHIDPHLVEIEHLGMQACIDAILKPARIAVDVMYLDRSEGEEVNTITWEPENPSEHGIIPRLRLLYRPGHYDLLYKPEDHILPPPPPTQVHLVSTENVEFLPVMPAGSTDFMPFPTGPQPFPDLMAWMDIQGLSYADRAFEPSIPSNFYPLNQYPTFTPTPVAAYPPPTAYPHPTPPSSGSDDFFRMTKYQLAVDYNQISSPRIPPCQTEAMKQAGESPAHYKNQEFQPIIWSPGSDRRRSP